MHRQYKQNGELTKTQMRRAEIAREYFAHRKQQTKHQKEGIIDRYGVV